MSKIMILKRIDGCKIHRLPIWSYKTIVDELLHIDQIINVKNSIKIVSCARIKMHRMHMGEQSNKCYHISSSSWALSDMLATHHYEPPNTCIQQQNLDPRNRLGDESCYLQIMTHSCQDIFRELRFASLSLSNCFFFVGIVGKPLVSVGQQKVHLQILVGPFASINRKGNRSCEGGWRINDAMP